MGILKKRKKEILKKFVLILGIAFLVGGWFFIRNAVIHDGDILGRETIAEQGELYAEDEYKPSLSMKPLPNLDYHLQKPFFILILAAVQKNHILTGFKILSAVL